MVQKILLGPAGSPATSTLDGVGAVNTNSRAPELPNLGTWELGGWGRKSGNCGSAIFDVSLFRDAIINERPPMGGWPGVHFHRLYTPFPHVTHTMSTGYAQPPHSLPTGVGTLLY